MVTERPGAVRSGAAVLAGGVLLALLWPGTAVAGQDPLPDEVSGGYVSWATGSHGVELEAEKPAVRGAGGLTWFPAGSGGADLGSGDADVTLAGTARLTGAGGPAAGELGLGGLRLRLEGGEGVLYVRDGQAGAEGAVALADLRTDGAEPVVRSGGLTWTGLRASLTADGARLLAGWSGRPFAEGDAVGELDVTLGTGGGPAPVPGVDGGPAPGSAGSPDGVSPGAPPAQEPDPVPAEGAAPQEPPSAAPAALVEHPEVAPGTEQRVTGEGFEPGEVVLVAIDEDTRYQAVADASGQVFRTFPVYVTATAGAHTAELYSVTGDRRASAGFRVRNEG
ncbi:MULTISPECIES: HtaA domain-containing protein [unclassified Streptomyces]|uniref:HtaA domain-containing protein n=1 Tax=unclassified Streptomyces TaxID=2593676 RepID=UPI002E1450A0|nr:HtaA domain-containing protein [Streptomyces sp. NBC_01201]